ncbi:hypothetical protein GCM10027445_03800 [Amycolatopsis endophytica]|uniref:Uncharacterized protein n=1 Tax=Amycolatopsis endophytica TaxID=860233 RepID=A0A853B932_9PSEU|nr:hypothetical protein [Amycolatopsis endophytica]NYI91282.1 hypothetical protein [Amycolatopsis endophytica]
MVSRKGKHASRNGKHASRNGKHAARGGVFAAPGAVFAAPGAVFAAPGRETTFAAGARQRQVARRGVYRPFLSRNRSPAATTLKESGPGDGNRGEVKPVLEKPA